MRQKIYSGESWLTFIEKQLILQFEPVLCFTITLPKYLRRIKKMQPIFEILFLIGNPGKISKGKKPV